MQTHLKANPYESLTWTPMEVHILRHSYPVEDIRSVMAKLPSRSEGAIHRMANKLNIKKPKAEEPTTQVTDFSNTKTIERLEAELNLRKAQAEYDAAQQRYALFAEQCRIAFASQMKNDNSLTMQALFKQNAAQFSKLNGSISNSARKLLEMRIQLEL